MNVLTEAGEKAIELASSRVARQSRVMKQSFVNGGG